MKIVKMLPHLTLKVLFVFSIFLTYTTESLADENLKIRLVKPDTAMQVVRGDYWTVYLDGTIDADAAKRLALELKRNNVKYGVAMLNSSGGNLFAGIEIGRLLRAHGLSTYITKASKGEDVSGECYSACVYAFVGGYFRTLRENDSLGVHRFSKPAPTSTDLDNAQIVSGEISKYLNEMGVDVKLFELTTRVSSNQIYILSMEEALKLRVANNGFQPAIWSIEASDKGLYLKGAQDAWSGLGKMTFTCAGNSIIVFAFYTTGENAGFISENAELQFIRLGDEFIDIKSVDTNKPYLISENGILTRLFILPLSFSERIKKAESIGYAIQTGNKDLFYGFKIDMNSDRKKILNYFTQCTSVK